MLDRLSHSREEAFHNCPHHFKARYLLGLPPLATVSGDTGTIVHKIISDTLLCCLNANTNSDIIYAKERASADTASEDYQVREDVIDIIDYYCNHYRFEPSQIVGIELPLAIDWDGNAQQIEQDVELSTVPGFRGILDLVLYYVDPNTGTKVLDVRDWKTGFIPPRFKQRNEDGTYELESDHQMYRYAYLAYKAFPQAEEIRLTLEFLRLKRTYPIHLDRDRLLNETWPNILKSKKEIEEAMAKDSFAATPSSQCGFCQPQAYGCPHLHTPAQPLMPKNREEAEKLAKEAMLYESAAAERLAWLERYCNTIEPRLCVGNRYYSTEQTENEIYGYMDVARALGMSKDDRAGTDKEAVEYNQKLYQLKQQLEALRRDPTDGQLAKFVEANKAYINLQPTIKYGKPTFDGRKRKPASWPEDDISQAKTKQK